MGYTSKDIKKLDNITAIKERPTMYIGNIGINGNSHLIREAIDNSIDEFLVGHCTAIEVTLDYDNFEYTVQDNARGIPNAHDVKGLKVGSKVPNDSNALYTILMNSHAGGKFDKDAYKVSGGLNGVGTTCINALSEYLLVISNRDGFEASQEYEYGAPIRDLSIDGKSKKTGTTFLFIPNEEIMETKDINREVTVNDLKTRAYLNKGLKITLTQIENGKKKVDVFHYPEGIKELVKSKTKNPMMDVQYLEIEDPKSNDIAAIEIALTYDAKSYEETIITFANGINTTEGGTHLQGFRKSITDTISKHITPPKGVEIKGEDCRSGIVAVVSVKLVDPKYEGQTKNKLTNSSVMGYINKVNNSFLGDWIAANPNVFKKISSKVLLAAKGRIAAKKTRENIIKSEETNFLNMRSLGKLKDCKASTPDEEAELFICEGNSASGTLKDARNTNQAVFSLRGKVVNTQEQKDIGRLLDNEELKNIVNILRCNIGKDKDTSKLRYKGGIFLTTDSDDDGAHILCLLLVFFNKYYPELIRDGYVKVALPPLYSINKGKSKKIFFNNKAEFDKYVINITKEPISEAINVDIKTKGLNNLCRNLVYYDELQKKLETNYGSSAIIEELAINKYFEGDNYLDSFLEVQTNMEVIENGDNSILRGHYSDGKYYLLFLEDTVPDIDLLLPLTEELYSVYQGEDDILLSELLKVINKTLPRRQRYKGLGENNAEDLEETVMDPATRKYITLKYGNEDDANEILDVLFGKDANKRKKFINESTQSIEDLL